MYQGLNFNSLCNVQRKSVLVIADNMERITQRDVFVNCYREWNKPSFKDKCYTIVSLQNFSPIFICFGIFLHLIPCVTFFC